MTELYKVLLVDDEEDVRQAVRAKLDWEALGFQVIGEAGNGQEALELAELEQPDVIMTDIKMPFMDGLELCRHVRRLLPATRLAILTGFDEFEYAREAITQQVDDYVLKPIDAENLAQVFARIKTSLDGEIAARRDMERLRRHYEQSLPMLRQQALLEWISGSLAAPAFSRISQELGLRFAAPCYCAAALRYEHEGEDAALLALSLMELVDELLPDSLPHYVVKTQDRIAVLFLLEQGVQIVTLEEALRQIFSMSQKLLGVEVQIGLGKMYFQVRDMARSFAEAENALEYQFLLDKGLCVYIGDIEPGLKIEQSIDPLYAEELLRQIKIGTAEQVQEAVGAMMEHLRAHSSLRECQVYLLELFTGLLRIIRTYRLNEEEARLDTLLGEGIAMRFAGHQELENWLRSFCENLRRLTRKERKDSICLLVDKARELLNTQYMDADLSLERVCTKLGVSPAYFSTIFKRETGEGFVGYLTGLRTEKALELLQSTDDKTYQIAEKIGYADPNYFSYVFKKRYGMSPSKYRGALKQEHAVQ